jgi:hypothetical protein
MRLIDDAEFWAGAVTANFVVPDRVFWAAEVDKAVEEFKWNRDRDRAAAMEFGKDLNLMEFFKRLDAWRKSHREVCRPADPECSCKSVGKGWLDTLVEDHVDFIFGWADLTDVERDRQIAWLRKAAISHLTKRRRKHATRALVGLPACDPAELLITSLATAPGAPPVLPDLLSEGNLAA